MDTWMWIAIWAAVIVVVGGLWLRERRWRKGWTCKPGADDPKGTSDVRMRANIRGQSMGGGGGGL